MITRLPNVIKIIFNIVEETDAKKKRIDEVTNVKKQADYF